MKKKDVINHEVTGIKFKEVREKHLMSIENLSIAMRGVSTDLIKKIEKGLFVPTLEYVFDFCNYFNVSIDEIIITNL